MKKAGLAGLALILSAGLTNCPLPTPTPDIYADEKQAITKGADRVMNLQNPNGSWDWDVTNATGSTATTYLNIAGVTGEGLLDAYDQTRDVKYLNAAKETGNYIIAGVGALPAERHFNAFNMVFLKRLANLSGDATYSDFVATKMNDLFTKVTYFGSPAKNISTDGIPGLTADELVAAEEVIRGAAINGIKPWDLYHFVQLAKDAGDNSYATEVAEGIKGYLDEAGYNSSVNDYILGLAGGVIGLKNAGMDHSSYLDNLVTEQKADGHFETPDSDFGTSKIASTAYALMALDKTGKTAEAGKAADYLVANQTYNGLDGWLEGDMREYSEPTGEAIHGLADFVK